LPEEQARAVSDTLSMNIREGAMGVTGEEIAKFYEAKTHDPFENKEDTEAQEAISIRAQLINDLEAAGQSTEVSQTVADIYSRYLYVSSKTYGMTVDELHNLSVRSAGGYDASNPEEYLGKAKYMQTGAQALGVSAAQDYKQRQFDIIQRTNPMTDDYHTGIRSAEEIKTLKETLDDTESFSYPDNPRELIERAIQEGEITVYSSNPIEDGTSVSTSRMMAQDYAGPNGTVHSKKVPVNCVAWINGDEGVYADAREEYERRLADDTQAWGKIVDAFTKPFDHENNPQPKADKAFRIMTTPMVLVKFANAPLVDMVITARNLNKVFRRKHKFSSETARQLPAAIANPMIIFKDKDNEFVEVLEIKDKDASVVVPVKLLRTKGRDYSVNEITSFYGKDYEENGDTTGAQYIIDRINNAKEGEIVYCDRKKTSVWQDQLATERRPDAVAALKSLPDNIPNENDLVNARAERNNKFYQDLLHASKADGIIRFDHGFMGTGEGQQVYGWGTYGAMAQSVVDWYLKQFTEKTPQKLKLGGNDFNLSAPFEVIAENEYFKELKREDVSGVVTILRDIFGWPVEKGESFIGNVRAYIKHLPYTWISKESLERITNWLDKHEGDIEYVAPSVKEPHLYKFRAPDVIKGENYLDWDNAVSRSRLERIYEGLKEKHPEANIDGWSLKGLSRENFIQLYSNEYSRLATGGKLYKDLAEALGSQEAASKFLDSIGIVGNIYLDGISRKNGEGTYNFVIFNEDNAQIIEQLFQEVDGEKRGSVEINRTTGSKLVELFAAADSSTFVHEMGHVILEDLIRYGQLESATDTARANLKTVVEFLGISDMDISDLDHLSAEDNARLTAAHEKWAEAFGKYIADGVAPSTGMRAVFKQVRRWLIDLFTEAERSGVELSPEVRGVFDSLLATPQEMDEFYEANTTLEELLRENSAIENRLTGSQARPWELWGVDDESSGAQGLGKGKKQFKINSHGKNAVACIKQSIWYNKKSGIGREALLWTSRRNVLYRLL